MTNESKLWVLAPGFKSLGYPYDIVDGIYDMIPQNITGAGSSGRKIGYELILSTCFDLVWFVIECKHRIQEVTSSKIVP